MAHYKRTKPRHKNSGKQIEIPRDDGKPGCWIVEDRENFSVYKKKTFYDRDVQAFIRGGDGSKDC